MHYLIVLPFFLFLLVTGIDEFYFHYKRGLPYWERISHPLDTLIVLACFLLPQFLIFSSQNLVLFLLLVFASIISVTKEEFIHEDHCCIYEKWLHSIFYALHPLCLICVGIIWWSSQIHLALFSGLQIAQLQTALGIMTALIGVFCIYQVIFWNFIFKENRPLNPRSEKLKS